mmetsp:Transcript_61719/g.147155  ORF Transcript_61719/g.147155 Transcript_61719/m.147155 type:complete len:214 (+) Transcript_61719:26-667(+)
MCIHPCSQHWPTSPQKSHCHENIILRTNGMFHAGSMPASLCEARGNCSMLVGVIIFAVQPPGSRCSCLASVDVSSSICLCSFQLQFAIMLRLRRSSSFFSSSSSLSSLSDPAPLLFLFGASSSSSSSSSKPSSDSPNSTSESESESESESSESLFSVTSLDAAKTSGENIRSSSAIEPIMPLIQPASRSVKNARSFTSVSGSFTALESRSSCS